MKLLEIAVFSIESAFIAAKAGANRLELCENYDNGGTTPSYGYLKTVRNQLSLPMFVMICPRAGDFVYNQEEFAAMKADILLCKQMGFDGIVAGVLKADGSIDKERMQQIVEWAYPMEVTFHRAFDRCNNPMMALQQIIACGCQRILTSGQQPSALEGKDLIQQLIDAANNDIIIVPGGGIRSNNLNALLQTIHSNEWHSSAKKLVPANSEYWVTTMHDAKEKIIADANEIAALQTILNAS
ncbi:copper homeostasis protein CutC [Hydrotalea sp.]|uniref:copper homeostasis protein CutC n=1 Tax=Hydrotalea sp. TaxID=2881279 RepID=UPI003D153054